MTTLGLAASVYTLGMKDAAVLTAKKVSNVNGKVWDKTWVDAKY